MSNPIGKLYERGPTITAKEAAKHVSRRGKAERRLNMVAARKARAEEFRKTKPRRRYEDL